MEKLQAILDERITGGVLVKIERVRVIKYAAAPKQRSGHRP